MLVLSIKMQRATMVKMQFKGLHFIISSAGKREYFQEILIKFQNYHYIIITQKLKYVQIETLELLTASFQNSNIQ